MSRLPLALLAVSTLAACATTGEGAGGAERAGLNQPAPSRAVDREARARIGREDMLTQMAFWAGEYTTFPNDIEAARRFAEALRLGGRYDRAVQISGESLGRFPDDLLLLNTYALAQLAQRNPAEAVQPLAIVASAEPRNWRARLSLGAALDQMGRFDEARLAYQEALTIEPNDPRILTNLGVSHLLAGEPEEAEPILRRAAEMPNAPPQARQNLSIALALMGRFQEAEQLQRIDLPPAQAQANIAYLRELRSDPRRWGDLQP